MVSIALPAAKRARYSEPHVAAASTKPRLLESPAAAGATTTATERLRTVLGKGVFRFLSLGDAAAVLNSCRALRTDAQRTVCVRVLPDFANMFPVETSNPFRLASQWPSHHSSASGATEAAPREQATQVVSIAGFLHKTVAQWRVPVPQPDKEEQEEDVLCHVEPVLLPLTQTGPLQDGGPWTRQPIQDALTTLCGSGSGEAFFNSKPTAQSRFATHWDSIYIDRVSGNVSCRICDAAKASIALYHRQVAQCLRQYDLVLRHKLAKWTTKTTDEIQQLTQEFRANYFHADAYIRPECLEWPEQQLLRHICGKGNFQAWQIGDTRARGVASTESLLQAVSASYQHQCVTLYQPLKKKLHRQCQGVIGRIPHATLGRGTIAIGSTSPSTEQQQQQRVVTELVGGVECSSGIFCGVQVTFRVPGRQPDNSSSN